MPDPGGADRRQRVATATGICRAACVKKSTTNACQPPGARLLFRSSATWGHSSAGRAPAWHAGGQRFDPAWLHQFRILGHPNQNLRFEDYASPSSRGLGHHPFTVATGVRIPVGTPFLKKLRETGAFFLSAIRRPCCAVPLPMRCSRPCRHGPGQGDRAGTAGHRKDHSAFLGNDAWRRVCGDACAAMRCRVGVAPAGGTAGPHVEIVVTAGRR